MDFQSALDKHFAFTGRAERDNMPSMAVARRHWGPPGEHGRHSLARVSRDMECLRGVEIGTHRGESAVMLCKVNRSMHLSCVDPYRSYKARPSGDDQEEHYQMALKRLRAFDAEIIRAKSMEVVDQFADDSIDLLHIDGDHEFDQVVQDLVRWVRKVRKGGLIMLHDYCIMWRGGVIPAVNAYTYAHRIVPWYVTNDRFPTAFWERGVEVCT